MANVITRYHRRFLPKPKPDGFFAKEMGALRSKRAGEIKTLRSQVGRRARGLLAKSYSEHIKGMLRKAALKKSMAAGAATISRTDAQRRKAATSAGYTRSEQHRKRGGGNVYRKVETGSHGKPRLRVKIFGKGDR